MKFLCRLLMLVFIKLTLVGCSLSFQKIDFRSAQSLSERGKFKQAVDKYSRVVKRHPEDKLALEAARRAARISSFEVKDFSRAAEFYHHLVLYSPDQSERVEAQKSLVDIYFDKQLNYEDAVIELSRLLPLVDTAERFGIKLKLARAHFYLNNLPQALVEVEDLIVKSPPDEVAFEALLFKGNILQTEKRLSEATKVFLEIQKKYPLRAQSENVGMSLAVCYEEQGDLKSAIGVLEDLREHHPQPDFIQIRINKLRERVANLPGAQGFKR